MTRTTKARRSAGILALSVLLIASLGTSDCDDASGPFPNIIVIIADDLGWADVGYHGSAIETPNLDALAAGGVRFENFHAQAWCSPARAAFLTGRFPPGFAWHVPGIRTDSEFGIDASEYTIAERLRDAGYATGLIGKWHQGTRPESHPNRNGFDYFYGFLGGYIGFYYKASYLGPHDWQRNGVEIFDELEYATTLLGEDAVRFVRERDPAEPFFLTLSFNAPHFPQQAPQEAIDKYAATSDCQFSRCAYMAQVDVMDQEIGRLVDTLEDEGIRENTLIVFFSDNGGALAFGGSNAPLRGQKLDTYEGGIRVPALMNWPAVLAEGQVRDQLILVSDLYSTLEAAAGLGRRAPAYSRNALMTAVWNAPLERDPTFFMSRAAETSPVARSRALITGDWKLVVTDPEAVGAESTAELFRITDDPGEQRDVSRTYAGLMPLLRFMLERAESGLAAAESSPRQGPGRLARVRTPPAPPALAPPTTALRPGRAA